MSAEEPQFPRCFRFWEQTANHGLAGGKLDATNLLVHQGYEVWDIDLETWWMLSEAEYHANWGV